MFPVVAYLIVRAGLKIVENREHAAKNRLYMADMAAKEREKERRAEEVKLREAKIVNNLAYRAQDDILSKKPEVHDAQMAVIRQFVDMLISVSARKEQIRAALVAKGVPSFLIEQVLKQVNL